MEKQIKKSIEYHDDQPRSPKMIMNQKKQAMFFNKSTNNSIVASTIETQRSSTQVVKKSLDVSSRLPTIENKNFYKTNTKLMKPMNYSPNKVAHYKLGYQSMLN